MSLTISYANGDRPDHAETLDEACRTLLTRYGHRVTVHDVWESAGRNTERLLVWATEEDADNDAGAKAVAEIIRTIPDQD